MSNPPPRSAGLLPALARLGIVAATVGVLYGEGRRSWCKCGEPRLFVGDGKT